MISSSNQRVDIQQGGFCHLLNFTAYACADWFCLLQAWLCMLSRKRCSVVFIIITIECWSYMLIICLCMNSSSFLGVVQVDLGTDAKHCFCKAGDLLAVVEWISAVAEDFRKINFLCYGVGCCCHFYIKLYGVFCLVHWFLEQTVLSVIHKIGVQNSVILHS